MGIAPSDFEDMTPVSFFYAYWGWADQQQYMQREEWERVRWGVWVNVSMQVVAKDRKPMTVMFPLPWDKDSLERREIREITHEERVKRVKELLKCLDNGKN